MKRSSETQVQVGLSISKQGQMTALQKHGWLLAPHPNSWPKFLNTATTILDFPQTSSPVYLQSQILYLRPPRRTKRCSIWKYYSVQLCWFIPGSLDDTAVCANLNVGYFTVKLSPVTLLCPLTAGNHYSCFVWGEAYGDHFTECSI